MLPALCALLIFAAPPTFDELKANFAQPDMQYAPFMFWFWDAPLDSALALEIAEKLAGQRINPGYIHARHSIATDAPSLPVEDWLSPKWFDALNGVAAVAEKTGTYVGFCDEYWWPSGRAGGRVLEAHPELRARSLKWKTFDLNPGERVDLPASFFTVAARHAEPFDPASLKVAAGPALGNWIWAAPPARNEQSVWFRRAFTLPDDAKIKTARIKITADDEYLLYCNDEFIGEDDGWNLPEEFELIAAVKPGRNVISIEAFNKEGAAGLIAGIVIELEGGELKTFATGPDWRVSDTHTLGWNVPDFNDSAWTSAAELGAADADPWKLADRGARHAKAAIESASLSLIGAGEPFTWTAPADGHWRAYSFDTYESTGVDNSDVNYLDNRLADAFIKLAYEPYLEHFHDKLGGRVPGVFMDNEGDYGYKLAWSDHLADYYQQKTGRDIRLWMPLMLDDDAEGIYAKARYDWFDCVSDIYAEFFSKINQWCSDHGLYLTGHLWEESLMLQAIAVGDFFQAQRAFSMPGTDCLGQTALDPRQFKETQSVAEFEGRRMSSEALGVAGWDMSPVLMKKSLNALTAWGVSQVIPHGVFMTRAFEGNYWPPDWYDENPYFRYLHLWSDFARRASYVNACGQHEAEVLLLCPMTSIWALSADGMFDPSEYGGVNETDRWFGDKARHIDAVYTAVIKELTTLGIDFLIADDEYVRKMAIEGDRLVLGPHRFRTVLVPPMVVMPLDVMRKLAEFAAPDRVLVLGELPTGSTDNGMNDPEMAALAEQMQRVSVEETKSGLKVRQGPRTVSNGPATLRELPRLLEQSRQVTCRYAVLLQHHVKIDGRDFFWLANNTGDSQYCEITSPLLKGAASIWDCETGVVRPVEVQFAGRRPRIWLDFKPYEAYWLVFDPQAELTEEQKGSPEKWARAEVLEIYRRQNAAMQAIEVAGPWRVRIDAADQPNLLKPVEVPEELRSGAEKSLADWNDWGIPTFTGFVDYETTFEFSGDAATAALNLGKVMHMAEVWLNGKPLPPRLWPPYVYDISGCVTPGANSLRIKVGNLIDKNLGGSSESGLFGPVKVTWQDPEAARKLLEREESTDDALQDFRARHKSGPSAEETLKAWRGRLKQGASGGRRRGDR